MRCNFRYLFGWWKAGVPPTWLVIIGCIVVQFGFGVYPVIVKKYAAQNKANPVVFSFYRDLCCFPILFLCALVAEQKIMIPRLKMLFVFMLLGLMGMFGNQLLYILGVYWAGPDIASAFQPIIPVWTTILAILSCTEKVPSPYLLHTWVKLIGIVLATGGAIELAATAPKSHSNTSNISNTTGNGTSHHGIDLNVLGYISLFGNTFCMAIYVLLQKRFIFNRPDCKWRDYPVAVTAYSYFFGAVFMGIATIYDGVRYRGEVFVIHGETFYALVYAIFVTSALCYLLITWSNMHLSATIVTAFWPAQVLVAVLGSYLVVGIKMGRYQYIGAAALIVALMFVLFSNHMEERLALGKSVIRIDFWRRKKSTSSSYNEKKPLLGGSVQQHIKSKGDPPWDSKGNTPWHSSQETKPETA